MMMFVYFILQCFHYYYYFHNLVFNFNESMNIDFFTKNEVFLETRTISKNLYFIHFKNITYIVEHT